jgi:uncharacterized LabA/DUF88 family protein
MGWNFGEDEKIPLDLGDRVAIFVDGGSLFRAASYLNLEVDYEKLLPCLLKGRDLLRAYFYTGFSPGNSKQSSFLRWMQNNGYRVMQKELTVSADGSRYADMGVEIAIDMLQFADHPNPVNVLVLVSQDVDLVYALEKIVQRGVRLEVVGVRSMMQESMMTVADDFVDLASMQDDIRKLRTEAKESVK